MKKNQKHRFYRKYGKRILDIALSLTAIVILSPLLLVLSILVLIFMGWPIIFKQPRPGKNEKIFNMYKFRTMTNAKDESGELLPDSERLPKFGKFLRSTSLDELPELFCILFGKMSFVGPRPLLVKYLPYYTEKERLRHSIRPGLTGFAQVNGRNLSNWNKRFKHDIKYVENLSFRADLKIIFETAKNILMKKDLLVLPSTQSNFKNLDEERRRLKNHIKKINSSTFEKHKSNIYSCLNELISNDQDTKKALIDMKKYLENGTANVYANIDKSTVRGLVWGYKIANKTMHINYLVVREGYKGQKIGSELLSSFIEDNKAMNIELLVKKENSRAISFYKKFNFVSFAHNEEKIIMRRTA